MKIGIPCDHWNRKSLEHEESLILTQRPLKVVFKIPWSKSPGAKVEQKTRKFVTRMKEYKFAIRDRTGIYM